MNPRLVVLALLLASCGGDPEDAATLLEVPVVYVSRLPPGCPDTGSPCAPMCNHHNAPAGSQVIVPLWGAENVRLIESSARRYEGVLTNVPTDVTLRLYGRDIGMCCVDACNYPPVLEDIYVNGTKLTRVVHQGLPAGAFAALEFTLTGNGIVRQ